MVSPPLAGGLRFGARVFRKPRRGKHPLPSPFSLRVGIFPREGVRQINARHTILQILLKLRFTFGVDLGSLMCVTMRNQPEYICRALNVAFRLQGALKDKDKQPAGKALVAAHYYSTMRSVLSGWDVTRVKRTLRNIGEDLHCYKINLAPDHKNHRA